MTDAITLDFDRLRQHAAFVESVADDVAGALSVLKGGGLASAAFGLMCAYLVPPTLGMTIAASGMLGAKEKLLLRTASELKDTANKWEQAEHDVVTTIRDVQKAMD